MSDRDPRPMPIEIQRAYRNPIDLRGLLMSSVYDQGDRQDVVDALMRSLIARYGDVWIMVGGEEMSVSTRLKDRLLKQDVVRAIELLSSIEEYGRSDGVLPLLAQAMQPRWAVWWASFKWPNGWAVEPWSNIVRFVLGQRQSAWLAAQCARTAIDLVRAQNLRVARGAIKAAEVWALAPSDAKVGGAVTIADVSADILAQEESRMGDESRWAGIYAAWAAQSAALAAGADGFIDADDDADAGDDVDARAVEYLGRTIRYASDAEGYANDDLRIRAFAKDAAYARLAALTKQLITPTLVTSASSGLRVSKATRRPFLKP
jgi:hypothetical protein